VRIHDRFRFIYGYPEASKSQHQKIILY